MRSRFVPLLLSVPLLAFAPQALADGWADGTKAPNVNSIANTRHNLALPYIANDFLMDTSRNDYEQVCVYCHTPHGANSTIDAPLWNRTNPGNVYTLYNIPLMSGQTPTQPGVNSLTCLSCHDGTVGIDSIINMPTTQYTGYPNNYFAAQETSQNDAFLDTWTNAGGQTTTGHRKLQAIGQGDITDSCLFCHQESMVVPYLRFEAFALTTDLTDDHPVGVKLPNTTTYDFKAPTATDGALQFYDANGNSRADSNEVRFYDTGEGFEVECASCHDPHGVDGGGGALIPSFLRVNNNASALCLTCHDK